MPRLSQKLVAIRKSEAASGVLLLGCTVLALLWANSPWATSYFRLWQLSLPFSLHLAHGAEDLAFAINDGLMAIFFLLVGLEIKREAIFGQLASFKKAALPIAAALGGMLVPASCYVAINHGAAGAHGWGIPMATDIAFAVGVLALLGSRVPLALKVFLTALAIADDIGAVLVIALFYTEQISWISLAFGAGIFLLLLASSKIGLEHPAIYVVLGIALWLAFLKSGIHPTIAGVVLALTIPGRAPRQTTERSSPMVKFEHALAPWVKFFIMPIFALANAGVALTHGGATFSSRVSLGIICGLFFGKPIGIVLFSWLATKSRLAILPAGVRLRQLIGVGILAGIGFTMSLFVANLAFGSGELLETAKAGILAASLLSGVAGSLVLLLGGRTRRA